MCKATMEKNPYRYIKDIYLVAFKNEDNPAYFTLKRIRSLTVRAEYLGVTTFDLGMI